MKLFLVSIGLFCVGTVQAQRVDRSKLPPIGISNVIEFALTAHPQAQIARDNAAIAEQTVRTARGDFKPSLSGGYDFSQSHNPISSALGDAQVGVANVTVTQPILNFASYSNYDAAKERLQAALHTTDAEHMRVAVQAALTYVEVLKLRITLDLAAENYDYVGQLITSMKEGDLKERATNNDIMLAETGWGTSLAEKYRWKSEAQISENNFVRDTHLTASDYFLVVPEILPTPLTKEEANLVASENNPRFAAAKANAEASAKDLTTAKRAYIPRLEGYVTGYNMQRPAGDFPEVRKSGVAAGVRVVVPVFDPKRKPNIATQALRQHAAALQAVDQSANIKTAIDNLYVQKMQRHTKLVGFCRSVRWGMIMVENIRNELLTKYTVQELLTQKDKLLKAGIDLNHEILAEVMDSFNIQLQMGTLMENLPEKVDMDQTREPNPHLKGLEAYKGLLSHCEDRKLFTLLPE